MGRSEVVLCLKETGWRLGDGGLGRDLVALCPTSFGGSASRRSAWEGEMNCLGEEQGAHKDGHDGLKLV